MQVTASSKYQVVIPEEIRRSLEVHPGQKIQMIQMIQMIQYGGHIVLVPVRPISEVRGILPGIDTEVEREPDRL